MRKYTHLAQIVLYDDKHKVFLQQRDNKTRENPNTIGLFGGGVKNYEKPRCAVRRECYEETSYILKSPKLLDRHTYKNGMRYVYIEKYDGTSALKCREGKSGIWLGRDDIIKNRKILPIDKEVLKKFFTKYR